MHIFYCGYLMLQLISLSVPMYDTKEKSLLLRVGKNGRSLREQKKSITKSKVLKSCFGVTRQALS